MLGLVVPVRLAWAGLGMAGGLFFLSVISLRILCLMRPLNTVRRETQAIGDEELPVYSVLVPLFRETAVLRQLLGALTHLDYPALCIIGTKTCESLSATFAPWNCRSSTP